MRSALSTAALLALMVPGPTAVAAEPDRFETAARGFVDGCDEADKVMVHERTRDRMPTNALMVQVWKGACRGAEASALTIVCAAPLMATQPPQCFVED